MRQLSLELQKDAVGGSSQSASGYEPWLLSGVVSLPNGRFMAFTWGLS